MTGSKMVFLDTAPIIYYLQCNELYYTNMKEFWKEYADCEFVTSAITITEYLTYPYRQNDLKLIDDFYSFINSMEINVKEIDRKTAEKAAQIRAEYRHFKTMDSLQLAAACVAGCDLFLTNDKQLRQFRELVCITVDAV